ncbi:DMT family transporter [Pukyongiella litopenaei]|nr:DMT family transporter [Pukyongiella litopenaei]
MADLNATIAHRPLAGILWMLAAGFCFVVMTAIVKALGTEVHPVQAAYLRYLLGLVFLLPAIPALRGARLSAQQWGFFGLRGVMHAAGVMLWFFAMTQIPLAEVTAMGYLTPVYVTIGAAFFLGEKLALRRILAIAAALLGVVIILRPGFREVDPGHLAMLITSFVFAGSYLLVKVAADDVNPAVVVAMLSIWVTVAMTPFAIAVWEPVSLHALGGLAVVACFATAGHYLMTRAIQAAPLTVTQPVTFLQLVWAVSLGALAFSEPVDGWVIAGGTLIMAAVSFITWREAVLKRRAVTPPNIAPKL